MSSIQRPADERHRSAAAARLLAIVGCAAMLTGCYTATPVATPDAPVYRRPHPCAIRGGPHSLGLFTASNRGGLNGEQRAEVMAFASRWRREATGGIVIDLPSGTRNEIAAASAAREVR